MTDDFEVISPKRGAPSKYESWMSEKIIEIAEQGGHIAQMCVAIGVKSEDTFHRWKKEIPEFGDAYDQAKVVSKAFYENLLLRGAAGLIPGFNATAMAMIMNNKFSDDYKRNASGNGDTQINITHNTLAISQEDQMLQIQGKLEKLKALGIDFNPAKQDDE